MIIAVSGAVSLHFSLNSYNILARQAIVEPFTTWQMEKWVQKKIEELPHFSLLVKARGRLGT